MGGDYGKPKVNLVILEGLCHDDVRECLSTPHEKARTRSKD